MVSIIIILFLGLLIICLALVTLVLAKKEQAFAAGRYVYAHFFRLQLMLEPALSLGLSPSSMNLLHQRS